VLAADTRQAAESSRPSTRRVLVAGTLQAIEAIEQALGGEAQVVAARSTEEALRRIDGGVDLIVCNVRFDESRMFDFLQALKSKPRAQGIPVMCCRTSSAPLPSGVKRAIVMALDALGIRDFVDCASLQRQFGAAGAVQRLRRIILAQLAATRPTRS
jgi:CheY-like chemotaxis protein